jgi:hypothetical protein
VDICHPQEGANQVDNKTTPRKPPVTIKELRTLSYADLKAVIGGDGIIIINNPTSIKRGSSG